MGINSVETTIFNVWDMELRKTFLFGETFQSQDESLWSLTSGNLFDHFLYRKIE
jgi:hypothetical protein